MIHTSPRLLLDEEDRGLFVFLGVVVLGATAEDPASTSSDVVASGEEVAEVEVERVEHVDGFRERETTTR